MGRSGCVASIMSVIERVKIEQTVDVFQTIKLIRAKRPGAVDTLVRLSPFLSTFTFSFQILHTMTGQFNISLYHSLILLFFLFIEFLFFRIAMFSVTRQF